MIEITMIMIGVYFFLLGLIIGSFLNVVIYRVPAEVSIAKGRSKCPGCDATIKAYDLIPVISYLILRGKCRNCGAKISARYPLIELLTGVMFLVAYLVEGFDIKAVLAMAVAAILISISAIDFDHMIIPNGLVIALIPIAVAYAIWDKDVTLLSRIIGAFAVSLPLFLLIIIIPDSFGGGDVKLMFVMGFILGWQSTLVGTFIGIIMGGAVATAVLLKNKRKDEGKQTHIPFGPWLAIGSFVALLFGGEIIDGYLNLMF